MENKRVIILSFTIFFITAIAMINIPTVKTNVSVEVINEIKHVPSPHYCKDIKSPLDCDTLSKINSKGTRTRCYIYSNELNRSTYKVCKTGWK